MLAKPVGFAIGCFLAIKAKQHNVFSTPQPCQIDCLVPAASTLVNATMSPQAFLVLTANSVYAEVFACAVVLGPAFPLELPFDCLPVDFPPGVVAGVEDFCESCFSPGVVDGNCWPSGAGDKFAVSVCEAGSAGNDADGSPPPSPGGTVDAGTVATADLGSTKRTRLRCANRAAFSGVKNKRCLRLTAPMLVSMKWA